MNRMLILTISLMASASAGADHITPNSIGGPGQTAPGGTLGSGTTNQTPILPSEQESSYYLSSHRLYAVGRGEQGEPNATVSSGVDRTTTTATTGMPIPFASVDRDDNGLVDWGEGQVLRDTGHDFQAADSDHDGFLSASEYQRMAGSRTP